MFDIGGGPSVELSGEACAERRRRREWAQRVTWERGAAKTIRRGKDVEDIFVLRRRRDEGASLEESWGLQVSMEREGTTDVKNPPHQSSFAVTVLEERCGIEHSRPPLLPGDEIIAATTSADLRRLELIEDAVAYAVEHDTRGTDLDQLATQTTFRALEAAASQRNARTRLLKGKNGEYVWLVVRRNVRQQRGIDSANQSTTTTTNGSKSAAARRRDEELSLAQRRPSFLARQSGDVERDALHDLAWAGFSRANRQEVYRGVAFAMEFLSTKRLSRRDQLRNKPFARRRSTEDFSTPEDLSSYSQRRRRTHTGTTAPGDIWLGDRREFGSGSVGTVDITFLRDGGDPFEEDDEEDSDGTKRNEGQLSQLEDEGGNGLASVRKRVVAAVFAKQSNDVYFETDDAAKNMLESALALQHSDAHVSTDLHALRNAWKNDRQLSFEDALHAARSATNRKGFLKRISKMLKRRSSPPRCGAAEDEPAARWVVDSLVVATQLALERAPPAPERTGRRLKKRSGNGEKEERPAMKKNPSPKMPVLDRAIHTELSAETVGGDDDDDYQSSTALTGKSSPHPSITTQGSFRTSLTDTAYRQPSSSPSLHQQYRRQHSDATERQKSPRQRSKRISKYVRSRTRMVFNALRRRSDTHDSLDSSIARRGPLSTLPLSANKPDDAMTAGRQTSDPFPSSSDEVRRARIALSTERVAGAYLARNSKLHNLDGGIHEAAARGLAATLLDKVGVDERTSFYLLAFFFEELAAEASIHDRKDSRDVASLSAALFADEIPELTQAFERAEFPPNPAMLECWLTLFPVALPEVTLLRWLDVFLFEGWEGLVNVALAWYRRHMKELLATAESAAQRSDEAWFSQSDPAEAIVYAIRDCLAKSADADGLLGDVKQTPNQMLHRHALSLESEIDENSVSFQDDVASHLFDEVMINVVGALDDRMARNDDDDLSDGEDPTTPLDEDDVTEVRRQSYVTFHPASLRANQRAMDRSFDQSFDTSYDSNDPHNIARSSLMALSCNNSSAFDVSDSRQSELSAMTAPNPSQRDHTALPVVANTRLRHRMPRPPRKRRIEQQHGANMTAPAAGQTLAEDDTHKSDDEVVTRYSGTRDRTPRPQGDDDAYSENSEASSHPTFSSGETNSTVACINVPAIIGNRSLF